MNTVNHKIEYLESGKIISAIDPENQPKLTRLEIFDSIDSTNSYLLNQSKTYQQSGMACFAEEQTAGRGRLGRPWFSPKGTNIYCSLLWRFKSLENLSGLSIAVGVMIIHALKKYGVSGAQLKWPNDVLYNDRKLAGILLEAKEMSVVIGIGINLHLPLEVSPNWIALDTIVGKKVNRNQLAGLLLNELLAQLPVFEQQGLISFKQVWTQQDALKGKHIAIKTPERDYSGVMQGINDRGELLLLEQEGDLRSFCYGEVKKVSDT